LFIYDISGLFYAAEHVSIICTVGDV